jgi:hypothetical protein
MFVVLFSCFFRCCSSFPHHNNEIAQACARHGGCNHSDLFGAFVHVGHLNIEGLKMSKYSVAFLFFLFLKIILQGVPVFPSCKLLC